VTLALALTVVGACGGDDAGESADSRPTTTPPSTTLAATTIPAPSTTSAPTTTVADTAPPTTTTEPAATTSTTVSTTAPPVDTPAPTVWFGTRLLGYFDGDLFVGNPGIDGLPEGLIGETIEVRDPAGAPVTGLVVAGCNEVEIDFGAERDFSLWYSPDAPLVLAGPDTAVGEEDMNADLAAMGIDPASAVSYGNAFTADGSVDRLVLVDGWNTPFQWPTWVATWDAETHEFATVEGSTDPSEALDIGRPITSWLDTDRDGNLELAFAVGDAYLLHELGTGETLAVGAVGTC